jgi:predicted TIM-barrel fold metal-dependent hydrolase
MILNYIPTPWGEIPVYDSHVHFFSYRFFSALAEQREGGPEEKSVEAVGAVLGWEMPPVEPERLAERWVAELDHHGVARAALVASVPGDADSVAAAVSAYPKRFYGYFMVDPRLAEAQSRIEKALAGGLLQGICLFPAMHRYSIHDDKVKPILEMVSSRPGTIVFVHCGVLTLGVRKMLGLPSLFDLRFSNPVNLHAVAARYPKVNFVIPHFGAGFFRETLMVCNLCPNVYLDTSSSNNWVRYLEGDISLRQVFERALDVVGPKRLLFGTDSSYFPRGWQRDLFESQVRILHEIGVSAEDARAILGENLNRVLARQ